MTSPRNRLQRRNHHLRMRVRMYRNWRMWREQYADCAEDLARRYADTRQPCSCSMCGNPRRRGELTVAERKARQAEKDDERT